MWKQNFASTNFLLLGLLPLINTFFAVPSEHTQTVILCLSLLFYNAAGKKYYSALEVNILEINKQSKNCMEKLFYYYQSQLFVYVQLCMPE